MLTSSASFAERDTKVTTSGAGLVGSLSFALWATLPSFVQAEGSLSITESVSNVINTTVASEAAAANNVTAAAAVESAFGGFNQLLTGDFDTYVTYVNLRVTYA